MKFLQGLRQEEFVVTVSDGKTVHEAGKSSGKRDRELAKRMRREVYTIPEVRRIKRIEPQHYQPL
jgi:hypothetical protein